MRFGCIFLTIFNTEVARAAESWRRKLRARGSAQRSARGQSARPAAAPVRSGGSGARGADASSHSPANRPLPTAQSWTPSTARGFGNERRNRLSAVPGADKAAEPSYSSSAGAAARGAPGTALLRRVRSGSGGAGALLARERGPGTHSTERPR